MVLKVFRIGNSFVRNASKKVHHSVLPSDIYAGKSIPKTRLLRKGLDRRQLVKYGGKYIVTLLPGAPPGPKLMSYVKDIFQAAFVPVDFEELPYSGKESEEETLEFGRHAIMSMYRNGVGLKGNIATPNMTTSSNVALRQELDLYACVVHVRSYPNIKCKYPNMDVFICRQNTEGEYAMLEHEARPGMVESLKVITAQNTARFADWCFNFALERNRRKITIVHKANIMKLSDGLFVKVIREVGRAYPQIQLDDLIVDNATMQLVQDPYQFDLIVTPNLYGNILSSIACGLIGGAGLLSGKNYGANYALFEAATRHIFFEDEKDLNPVAILNAAIDLLNYLGKTEHANVIFKAITKTLSVDKIQTPDIGGTNTCDEMVESIKNNIKELMETLHVDRFEQ